MNKSRRRIPLPSPAMVVALIALFAALGGSVYAANRISGKAIKAKSLPGNRVIPRSLSGNRIKPNSLTRRQVKESTLRTVPRARRADWARRAATADRAIFSQTATLAESATRAGNADRVNDKVAECPEDTQLFLGSCWQRDANPAQSAPEAASSCADVGGALPAALELSVFAQRFDVTLAAGDEWSADVIDVAALDDYSVATVSAAGAVNFTNATADSKQYRCVIPLLR